MEFKKREQEVGGGYDITQVLSVDPAGMIPGFIIKKVGSRTATNTQHLINYLTRGEVPENPF